jgi:hypothetical protein
VTQKAGYWVSSGSEIFFFQVGTYTNALFRYAHHCCEYL